MRNSVSCYECRSIIGSVKVISYPSQYDYMDYTDFEADDNYGGEHEGERLCFECYKKAKNLEYGEIVA